MTTEEDLQSALELETTTQAVVNGTTTNARPEVALVNNNCTATLISPRHFVTASHCVGHAPLTTGGTLQVTRANGTQPPAFAVDRIVAFDSANGLFDVALGRLVNEVPTTDVPSYASLATTRFPSNQTATIVGYGCTSRVTGVGFGTKRFVQIPWHNFSSAGNSQSLCPGDSGGPVFGGALSSNGALIASNSHNGDTTPTGNDGFAEATMFTIRQRIANTIAGWEGGLEPGWDRPGLDFQTTITGTAASCRTTCLNNATCRAFTWVHSNQQCWLKRAGAAPQAAAGVTSGVIDRKIEPSVNRAGHDFATSPAANVQNCQQICEGNARCASFTFVPSTGTCWLKDVDAAPSVDSTVSSGVRPTWDVNLHVPGHDIRSFNVADWNNENRPRPEVCQAECRNDPTCYNWTLETSSIGGVNRCWLKGWTSSGAPYASAAGVISGGTRVMQ